MLVDAHAHLLDKKFNKDRFDLIKALPESGVGCVIECASDMDSSVRAAALAEEYHIIYAAVGVHPHDAKEWEVYNGPELRALAARDKVVAIGEIGLDYHYDFSPRKAQQEVFEKQLDLAKDLNMPVVIHSREATEDTVSILKAHSGIKGMMHSFAGSVETMETLLGLGYYFSFGGMITFANAKKPAASAAAVPLDRFMVETDCPYMTPTPHRGERNTPAYVRLVAEKIAALKSIAYDEVEELSTANAAAFFGLDIN